MPLLLVFHDTVRVVRGLRDPETAARVPGESDRLHDVGLGSEEHQLHVGRDLRTLHAALDGIRLLEGQRLGALLVIGDLRVLLTDLGITLGEELLPGRFALGKQGGLELGTESGGSGVGLDDDHRDRRARRQLDRSVEGGRTIGVRLHRQGVVTFKRRGVRRQPGGVIEPDRIAPQFGHQGVKRTDGGLFGARGVQIQDADRTGGGSRGDDDGEADGKKSDEETHRGMGERQTSPTPRGNPAERRNLVNPAVGSWPNVVKMKDLPASPAA